MAADPKVGRAIGSIDSGGVRLEGEAYYVFGWAPALSGHLPCNASRKRSTASLTRFDSSKRGGNLDHFSQTWVCVRLALPAKLVTRQCISLSRWR